MSNFKNAVQSLFDAHKALINKKIAQRNQMVSTSVGPTLLSLLPTPQFFGVMILTKAQTQSCLNAKVSMQP